MCDTYIHVLYIHWIYMYTYIYMYIYRGVESIASGLVAEEEDSCDHPRCQRTLPLYGHVASHLRMACGRCFFFSNFTSCAGFFFLLNIGEFTLMWRIHFLWTLENWLIEHWRIDIEDTLCKCAVVLMLGRCICMLHMYFTYYMACMWYYVRYYVHSISCGMLREFRI